MVSGSLWWTQWMDKAIKQPNKQGNICVFFMSQNKVTVTPSSSHFRIRVFFLKAKDIKVLWNLCEFSCVQPPPGRHSTGTWARLVQGRVEGKDSKAKRKEVWGILSGRNKLPEGSLPRCQSTEGRTEVIRCHGATQMRFPSLQLRLIILASYTDFKKIKSGPEQ